MVLGLVSCAHNPPNFSKPDTASDAPAVKSGDSDHDQIAKLQEKIQDLETRLGALNDKINLENGVSNSNPTLPVKELPGAPSKPAQAVPTSVVEIPPAHAKVVPTTSVEKKTKVIKMSGDNTSHSEAIDRFREAKILYDSKRYSDAVLEFSEFVKNESEHPLASAAQYYVGMSYFNQKEYKLAEEELSRGLLSYPHSSYIPDTLLALSKVSEMLKKPTKVTYYREKLMSHFPNSPQAKKLNSAHVPETAPETPEAPEAPAAEMKTTIEPSVVGSKEIAQPEVPALATPVLEGDSP